jgi:hypothetical protein
MMPPSHREGIGQCPAIESAVPHDAVTVEALPAETVKPHLEYSEAGQVCKQFPH